MAQDAINIGNVQLIRRNGRRYNFKLIECDGMRIIERRFRTAGRNDLPGRTGNRPQSPDQPPVREPPGQPGNPPVEEPDDPPPPPPPPNRPPLKEPPDKPGKPPVKEPPPEDPKRSAFGEEI